MTVVVAIRPFRFIKFDLILFYLIYSWQLADVNLLAHIFMLIIYITFNVCCF